MFHGINGCPAAAAQLTIWKMLDNHGVIYKPKQHTAVIRDWLGTQPNLDQWMEYTLRERGYGHLLDDTV